MKTNKEIVEECFDELPNRWTSSPKSGKKHYVLFTEEQLLNTLKEKDQRTIERLELMLWNSKTGTPQDHVWDKNCKCIGCQKNNEIDSLLQDLKEE